MTMVERPTHSVLPKVRPPVEDWEVAPFDWPALIDKSVHEVKVAIVEALWWIEQPLSAKELWEILGVGRYVAGTVAYHVKSLKDMGLIVPTSERAARGARETYYLPALPRRR
jgi:predicted transcriptional regulator